MNHTALFSEKPPQESLQNDSKNAPQNAFDAHLAATSISYSSRSVFVAALTWVLKDSLGEVLDVLDDPVEFLVGGDDLLPIIDKVLQSKPKEALLDETFDLYIEPEQGFGEFDEQLIFLIPREAFSQEFAQNVQVGMGIDGSVLHDLREEYPSVQGMLQNAPSDVLYTVTDIYPEHLVIDGNHPLAGISLQLLLKVHGVREATDEEVGNGSAGIGFFKIS